MNRESPYETIRSAAPALVPQRMRKPALLELSYEIERTILASRPGTRGALVGGFQRPRFFAGRRAVWHGLAERTEFACALAEWEGTPTWDEGVLRIPLDHGDLRAQEWFVVHLRPGFGSLVTAREVPMGPAPDDDLARTFDSCWTQEVSLVTIVMRSILERIAPSIGADAERIPSWTQTDLGPI